MSVFSGQRCAVIVPSCMTCDFVVEQIPPVQSFGREFALVPIDLPCVEAPACCNDPAFCSRCTEIFRVVAAEDGTVVQWTGSQSSGSVTLQSRQSEYVLIPKTDVASLSSNKPILAGHYFNSVNYNGPNSTLGDPSFSLVTDTHKYQRQYRGVTCCPGFDVHHANLALEQGSSGS